MKYFVFRFDVDTHKCLSLGTKPLIQIGSELGVSFTFFVNCGKAIHHGNYFKRKLKNKKSHEQIAMLTPFYKLGVRHYFKTAVMNPSVIYGNAAILHELINKGHEVGLHGGQNHEDWHYNAQTWGKEKIRKEIQWGVEKLRKLDTNLSLSGFASPGWTGSQTINAVLKEKDFSYVADIHTDTPIEEITRNNGIYNLPTNIVGEPGGVGYIEHCRARGMNNNQIEKDFISKLKKRQKLAVVYDHPYVAGIREHAMVRRMVTIAIDKGYTVTTLKQVVTSL